MFDRATVDSSIKSLSGIQKRNIAKVLELGDSNRVSAGDALVLWTADLISLNRVCDAEQIRLIIDELFPHIVLFGSDLHRAVCDNASELPAAYLCFTDRRFVSMSGVSSIIDLADGQLIKALPNVGLELISYNLTRLFVYRSDTIKSQAIT